MRRRLGYCPQQDPLLELMTGRETLLMFARLKNLPEARLGALVAAMLRQTSLLPYADVVAGAYSAGRQYAQANPSPSPSPIPNQARTRAAISASSRSRSRFSDRPR